MTSVEKQQSVTRWSGFPLYQTVEVLTECDDSVPAPVPVPVAVPVCLGTEFCELFGCMCGTAPGRVVAVLLSLLSLLL